MAQSRVVLLELLGPVALALLVGCGSVSVRQTGANSVADLQKEDDYRAVWQKDVTTLRLDTAPLAPNSSSPGVCNKGGTKQGCYDADEKLIADIAKLLAHLSSVPVPPRFSKGNALVREGFQTDADGLRLRDQVISGSDPSASFGPSNAKLQEALDLITQGYNAFPTDNRPVPNPT